MTYHHILLAVDFAVESRQVMEKAMSLARQSGVRLTLLHVLDNIAMPDTAYGTVIDLAVSSGYPALEAEKARFNQLADELAVMPAQRRLIWGNPKQEIVELAGQIAADLIVVGSHGRHGLGLLLGSTANAVLHHAKCDVLAVRIKS